MSSKIQIPTDTMEREFSAYHRRGYQKGLAENDTRIAELEAQLLHLSEVASIKHDFENICEYNIGCGFTPESLRLWLAQNKEKLYTSPQAITPISADDVTDEMLAYIEKAGEHFDDNGLTETDGYKAAVAATYNAVIKHRSETK